MIEQQLDRIAEDFEYRLRSQGMTLQGYLQMSGGGAYTGVNVRKQCLVLVTAE